MEGIKKNFHCRSARNAGPARKEFITKVAGLKNHTFDVGNAKYAAKYQKTVDVVANHIQCDYKGGYPTPAAGTVINKGLKYIWQQEVQEAMKRIVLLNKIKKQAYALVFGQCLPSSSARSKVQAHTSRPIRIRTLPDYSSSSAGAAAALMIISRVCMHLREQNTEY